MANQDILNLPVAIALDGSEYVPLVQGLGADAVTRRATATLIADTASVGGAGGITIGSTAVTNGTSTSVLFNNVGVAGEYAISGSGSVAMTISPALITPALGTPTAGVLSSCTGLPVSTGIAGLGTGIATFLATPSSANFAAAVTGETGSGALVFGTSPTLVTPVIGAATGTSAVLTNQFWSGSVSAALSTLTGGSDGFRTSAANATIFAGENTTTSSASAGGLFGAYSNDGAAMASGDRLGGIRMGGSSSASTLRNSAGIFAFADQAWVDASAYGSRLELQTTTNGATALSTKAILSNAGLFALGATLANTVPGLKRSSAILQARLGDDSAYCAFEASALGAGGASAANTFLNLAAGTTAIAPAVYTSGTNLTSAAAGAREFDGVQHYATIDTTSGRGAIPVEQYFHLAANGSTISTIANFFGANSNIALVASGYYIIDIYLWYTVATQGTVTWTLTNSAAPTSQNIYYEMSPVPTGIVAPPGTATMLVGQVNNDATAAYAATTGTINDATTNFAHFKIWLKNSTGVSLLVQATKNVGGTLTPQLNSYWHARRISPTSTGTFVA